MFERVKSIQSSDTHNMAACFPKLLVLKKIRISGGVEIIKGKPYGTNKLLLS